MQLFHLLIMGVPNHSVDIIGTRHGEKLYEAFENLSKNNLLAGFEVKERFYEIGSISGLRDFEKYIEIKKLIAHGISKAKRKHF